MQLRIMKRANRFQDDDVPPTTSTSSVAGKKRQKQQQKAKGKCRPIYRNYNI